MNLGMVPPSVSAVSAAANSDGPPGGRTADDAERADKEGKAEATAVAIHGITIR